MDRKKRGGREAPAGRPGVSPGSLRVSALACGRAPPYWRRRHSRQLATASRVTPFANRRYLWGRNSSFEASTACLRARLGSGMTPCLIRAASVSERSIAGNSIAPEKVKLIRAGHHTVPGRGFTPGRDKCDRRLRRKAAKPEHVEKARGEAGAARRPLSPQASRAKFRRRINSRGSRSLSPAAG
jgi:hypothetical protein